MLLQIGIKMKNHDTADPETVYAPDDQPSELPAEPPIQYRYDAPVLDSVNEMPNQETDLQMASSGEDDPGMDWMQKRNHLVNHFARMNRKKRAYLVNHFARMNRKRRAYLVNHFARMNRKKRARDIMLVIF